MNYINSVLLDLMLDSKWLNRKLENPSFTESEEADIYYSFYNKLNKNQKEEFSSLIHKMDLNYERVYLNNTVKMINLALKIGMEIKEMFLDIYEI